MRKCFLFFLFFLLFSFSMRADIMPRTNIALVPSIDRLDDLSRGYTGHEHLDMVGLINMNGRMYDPVLGRMLSPDPFVPDATYTQDFNRYFGDPIMSGIGFPVPSTQRGSLTSGDNDPELSGLRSKMQNIPESTPREMRMDLEVSLPTVVIKRDGITVMTGFKQHAAMQVITRKFLPVDILTIIKKGNSVNVVGKYGSQTRYTLGNNTVVIDDSTGKIITVFSNYLGSPKGINKGLFAK